MSNTLQIRSQVWYYSIKLDTSWVARRAWVYIWSISNISGNTAATTKRKTSLDAQRIVLSNDTMKSPESNSKIVYRIHFHFFLDTLYLSPSEDEPPLLWFFAAIIQIWNLFMEFRVPYLLGVDFLFRRLAPCPLYWPTALNWYGHYP